jgi:anti-sigma-K factor RskA
MSNHRQFREWSAAYVLGSLDPEERADFEIHLVGCEECRAEVVSLAPLPGLLSRVELDEPVAPERILTLASGAINKEWEDLQRSRRRWRWAAAVAAVAAVFTLLLPLATDSSQTEGATLVFAPESVASGTVVIVEKAWGTAAEIELTGLPQSDVYVAWAVTDDGRWEQMASWGPTPKSTARVAGASSLATDEVDAIVITTGDRAETVAIANKEA